MKALLLRLLGSSDHQYVTKKEHNELKDKMDAIIKHYDIKLTSRTSYKVTTKQPLGFNSEKETS